MFDFHQIADDIYRQQAKAIDRHFLTFLKEQGITWAEDKVGIERDLKEKGLEIILDTDRKTNGDVVYTFKVVKVVTKTNLLIKFPQFTHDTR